ncbi:MAG: TolC family protein [Gemmatimonadota bacterium]|nr:TolC family protein [Gemmatimonadota bacterium]
MPQTRRARRSMYAAGAVFATVFWSRASAQSASRLNSLPPRGATLADVMAFAVRESFDLQVARAVLDSARAEQQIAHALPNPNYVASPNTPYQYGATITLDVGPQRIYRTRAAALAVRATEFDRRDVARQMRFAVARAFYDLVLADTLFHLSEARRALVLQVLAGDSARVRAGDVPERNLFRSEGELARAEADLARARVAIEAASLALQGLIGIATPDTGFTITGDLRYVRRDAPADSVLLATAGAIRPDLAASGERVEQSSAQRRLAAASIVPVPQLSYVRQFTAPFESGHFYAFGVTAEVPLLNFYHGQRERAAAGADASRTAHRRAAAQVRRDVIGAATNFRTERVLVERFEGGLLAKSDAAVEASRYAYGRGATSLLDVLDAVRSQQDIRIDYYTALHDYWVSTYALCAAVGTDIFSSRVP